MTLAKTGTGNYRFGATGVYFSGRWRRRARRAPDRCLNVKTGKIERCK